MRGGLSGAFFTAARKLNLSEPQKIKLGALEDKLREDGPSRSERQALDSELAAQVRAGKVDPAKLEPLHQAIERVAQAKHARDLEALAGLHAALEPEQRKAIAASVRERESARAERLKKRSERGGDGASRITKRVERLTRDLDLDAAQQKTVESALKATAADGPEQALERAKKRSETVVAAFEKDSFDPKALVELKPAPRSGGRLGLEEQMLAKLVPTLKPEQREKLAAKMSEGDRRSPASLDVDGDDHDD